MRELNKELASQRKEIQTRQQEVHELEGEKNEEIQKLKQSYESQIAELHRDLTQAQDNQGSSHISPEKLRRIRELEQLNS